jgi:hypothetical protein
MTAHPEWCAVLEILQADLAVGAEGELCRAEPDALDSASGDLRQLVKVRTVPCGPPGTVTWRPAGSWTKAVA